MDDAQLNEGASGEATRYELHQPACFYDDEYNKHEIHQIKTYLDSYLIDYLNGKNSFFGVNVIGSPSAAGIVFKISFVGITLSKVSVKQCYALKIMPYTNETPDNTNELYFAELLSNIDNNKFAFLYCKYKNVNLNSTRSIVTLPVNEWYKEVVNVARDKIENHEELYTSVKKYNLTYNKKSESFLCDIMVSRLYWGDLIAFMHNTIEQPPNRDSNYRCSNYDVCERLTTLQNSIEEWKLLLTKILASIKVMRNYNIIHGDLHCGNILIDFNGEPIIHDFGKTKLYTPPINIQQLCFNDTIDFRNIINAISKECIGNVLKGDINFYLVNVCEAINTYCLQYTKYGDEANLEVIDISHLRGERHTPFSSGEVFSSREELFKDLTQIINTEYSFHLKQKLIDIGLSDVTTYDMFKSRKTTFVREPTKYLLYKIIGEWWNNNPSVEVEASGGGRKRINYSKKNKKKQSRRKKSSKPKNHKIHTR